jgi:uncharacterized membrane-anchored protein
MTEIQAIRKALHENKPQPGRFWEKGIEEILNEMLTVLEEQQKIINAFKLVEKSRWQAAYKNMEQFNQHQVPRDSDLVHPTHG